MAVYDWNFRNLQTINEYQKNTQQGKLVRNFFLHLDEKCSRGISYSSQIVFFQSLHYTCFSSAICPFQVPVLDLRIPTWVSMVAAKYSFRSVPLLCK